MKCKNVNIGPQKPDTFWVKITEPKLEKNENLGPQEPVNSVVKNTDHILYLNHRYGFI